MSGILVVDMAHEQLDFVSGGFKGSQLSWDIYIDGKAVLYSPLGSVVRGENGLYRVDYGGMKVIWMPPAERSLQVRLMVYARMQQDGHQGICATMHWLGAYCVWEGEGGCDRVCLTASTLCGLPGGERGPPSVG